MKSFKTVVLIVLGLAFVGGVGSWLFTFSAIGGWIFFLVCAFLALDYTYSFTGFTTWLVGLFTSK